MNLTEFQLGKEGCEKFKCDKIASRNGAHTAHTRDTAAAY